MFHYNFKPGWIPALATVLLCPLFVSLGIWQWHRAEQKESLMALHAERFHAAELVLDPTQLPAIDEVLYRRVVVEGRYDEAHQILLDNQIVDHKAGYFVLTPLILPGGGALLVNRGWVPLDTERSRLPAVAVTGLPVRARGVVDKFPAVGWRLQGAEIPTSGWPAVVQLLDSGALASHLGYPVVPYQVLLDAAEPEGYVRRWRHGEQDPDRNRGYALQWFSFAAILSALFIWFGFKPTTAGCHSNRNRSTDS